MRAAEYLWRTMLGIFLLGVVALALPAREPADLLVILFLQQVILGLGGYLGMKEHPMITMEPSLTDLGRGFGAGVALFLMMGFVTTITVALLSIVWGWDVLWSRLLVEREGMDVLVDYASTVSIGPVFFLTVIGAAVSEELFFRGLLLPLLETKMKSHWAVLLSALIFAVFHRQLLYLPALFVSGLWLGLLFRSRYRIWVPIGAHAVANAIVLTLALAV